MKTNFYLESLKFKKILIAVVCFLIAVALLSLVRCIDTFEPKIDEEVNMLVIDGNIIKGLEYQEVRVSRASKLSEAKYIPVNNCQVSVIDDLGNVFNYDPSNQGEYRAYIDQSYLNYHSKFKIHVVTPEGNIYESDFDEILECPPVDSIYSKRESEYLYTIDDDIEGLQFYLDLKATENQTRYYRWVVDETFEYHARYQIDYYYVYELDSMFVFKDPDSLYFCYSSGRVSGLFSSNTQNLIKNEKKMIPLHYIGGGSIKLSVRYSCLVNQYALSEKTFDYWNQKKVDMQESQGLYTTQPAQAKSNIKNINNPKEIVLGYFWASSKTEKRYFYKGPFGSYYMECDLDTVPWKKEPEEIWPRADTVYISFNPLWDSIEQSTDNQACFDCTLYNGTTVKPDFW